MTRKSRVEKLEAGVEAVERPVLILREIVHKLNTDHRLGPASIAPRGPEFSKMDNETDATYLRRVFVGYVEFAGLRDADLSTLSADECAMLHATTSRKAALAYWRACEEQSNRAN